MKSTWTRGVLSAALAVSMTLGLSPVAGAAAALADDSEFQDEVLAQAGETRDRQDTGPAQTDLLGAEGALADPIPASKLTAEAPAHSHDGVTFATAWTATDSLPSEAGVYFLDADVTITQTWEPADGTSLCLNGHTITADIADATDAGAAIQVDTGRTFSLYDCGSGALQAASGKVVGVGVNSQGGAFFNLHGGTIKGFGIGVMTDLLSAPDEKSSSQFGTFNMNGGTITGCTTRGVYVFSGTFNMKGGLITQNTSLDDGAGVYVQYSTFNMSGGEISHNSANRNGGGLYVFHTTDITISGGSITGNRALGADPAEGEESGLGGGVYVDERSALKLTGTPMIVGNTAAAGKTSNVQLGGKPISVTGKLESGAQVGITQVASAATQISTEGESDAPAADPSAFTSGYKKAGNTVDPQAYFVSDDASRLVGWTESGEEARLVAAHNVVVAESSNGSVAASATKARANDTVTLTVTPAAGYQLKALTVTDADKKDITVTDNAFVMPASDVTVSATFEAAAHTISFDANGGSGTMDAQTVTAGQSATLNANKFTRSGYTFKAWNTQKDGSGVSYADKGSITPQGDVTLYAQWTASSSSGSSSSSTSSKTSSSSSSSLAKTGDSASPVGIVAALAAGAGAVAAYVGIRRKRRE